MSETEEQGDAEQDEFVSLLQRYQDALDGGRMGDADVLVLEMMKVVEQRIPTEPSPELALQIEADRCEQEGDWHGAKAAYQKALSLAIASSDRYSECRNQLSLSGTCRLLGDHESALAHARSATSAARKSADELKTGMVLRTTLQTEARRLLQLNRVEEAHQALDEAISVVEACPHDVARAGCLVVRAKCHLLRGDTSECERDLNEAWEILEPMSAMFFAGGAHSGLAEWWRIKAEYLAWQGDADGAKKAMGKAVERIRHAVALPQARDPKSRAMLADLLRGYGEALAAAGKSAEAQALFDEAREIRRALKLPAAG
jgi:tetratricopeptide (TPR) repeat protein